MVWRCTRACWACVRRVPTTLCDVHAVRLRLRLRHVPVLLPTSMPTHMHMRCSLPPRDIPLEVEEIVQILLDGLCDKDTVVRWSAAKGDTACQVAPRGAMTRTRRRLAGWLDCTWAADDGMSCFVGLGRLTQCLPAECGEDVVLAVLELFARRQSEENDVRGMSTHAAAWTCSLDHVIIHRSMFTNACIHMYVMYTCTPLGCLARWLSRPRRTLPSWSPPPLAPLHRRPTHPPRLAIRCAHRDTLHRCACA